MGSKLPCKIDHRVCIGLAKVSVKLVITWLLWCEMYSNYVVHYPSLLSFCELKLDGSWKLAPCVAKLKRERRVLPKQLSEQDSVGMLKGVSKATPRVGDVTRADSKCQCQCGTSLSLRLFSRLLLTSSARLDLVLRLHFFRNGSSCPNWQWLLL